jgi:hypothetical protein
VIARKGKPGKLSGSNRQKKLQEDFAEGVLTKKNKSDPFL